jgi:hypothetical protein
MSPPPETHTRVQTPVAQNNLRHVIPQFVSAFSGLSRWDCRPLETQDVLPDR